MTTMHRCWSELSKPSGHPYVVVTGPSRLVHFLSQVDDDIDGQWVDQADLTAQTEQPQANPLAALVRAGVSLKAWWRASSIRSSDTASRASHGSSSRPHLTMAYHMG